MRTRGLVLIMLVMALASCSGHPSKTSSFAGMSGEQSFPAETLSDWVSYSDQVSIVRVTADAPLPLPTSPNTSGGYQGRKAEFTVERTLWTAPGVTPRSTFSMNVAGWLNGKEACIEDSPRVEVGDRFVMPISHYDDGEVTALSSTSLIPLTSVRGLAGGYTNAAHEALRDVTNADMTTRLAAATANPIAAKYRSLPPHQRAQKVYELTHR